ncbi:MAG: tetratricopeptide repeat-containing sensor histidine kinase [Bacteroidales bacterium]|nr:tetratricopeptide repeat-containing sensor histidine kinase [Bacteroidales bacterium]
MRETITRYIAVSLLLLVGIQLKGLNVDSLRSRLHHSDSENQSEVYERLLEHFFYNNPDSAIHYSYLLLANSEVYHQDSMQVKALMSLGLLYYLKGDPEKSVSFIQKGDEFVGSETSFRSRITYNYYKGIHKLYISELDSALLYLDRSLNMAEELNDVKFTGRSLLNIGNVYWYNGHYTLALRYYQQSIEYLEKASDDRGRLYVLFNIANIYRSREEIRQGIKYYDEAYKLAAELQDNIMQGSIMNNKGLSYAGLNKSDSALLFVNKALDIYLKMDMSKQIMHTQCNKARYLIDKNSLDSANYYLNLVEQHKELDQYPREHVNYLFVKAKYSKVQDNYPLAIDYLNKALELTGRYFQDDNKLAVLELLSDAEAKMNNFEKAYAYSYEASQIQDSIYNIKKTDEMAFLQKAFELMKQEKQTELLKTRSRLLEMELEKEKHSLVSMVVVSVLLGLLTLVIFNAMLKIRQKKKELIKSNTRLINSNEELVQANAVKNKLFSVLSHDLKSPLSSIVSMTSLMELSPTITDSSDLQMVHAVGESSNMMLSFIDNTLFWFKKVHGNLKPDYQPLSMEFLMDEIDYWFQSFSKQKKISLLFDGEDVQIVSDKNILMVLLRNVVSNAIKFSNEGDKVIISWTNTDEHVVLKVKDYGIGMSQEQLEALNKQEGINQFANGTNGETSTGLGLFLCQELLHSIGGQMLVNSTRGEGTEVYCYLKKNVG